MYAVDVGLDRPRQPARLPDGPQQRCGEDDGESGRHRDDDGATRTDFHFRGEGRCGQPAAQSHQHHRDADHIKNVHSSQVAPGCPSPTDKEFLQAKQQAQTENFRTAADGCAGNGGGREVLAPQFFSNHGERHSRDEQKQRGGQGAEELRDLQKTPLARRWREPCVVAMGLKHQHAGEPPHPVNVGEAGCRGSGHAWIAPTHREVYT